MVPYKNKQAMFRKRPVVVHAYRYEGSAPLLIPTIEGEMTAMPGDWIITGVAGEIYPCKPDIFEETYEPVSSYMPPICRPSYSIDKLSIMRYDRHIVDGAVGIGRANEPMDQSAYLTWPKNSVTLGYEKVVVANAYG